MSSLQRFKNLSEYSNYVHVFLYKHLSSKTVLFAFTLFTTLVSAPSTILAEEKQPVDTSQKATPTKTTEGLLASTEQMIEQLIQQIDLQKENNHEKAELTDNPNPTSFSSSIPNIRPVGGKITSNYGVRFHPVYHIPLFHAGIDFSVPVGTSIQAAGDGVVAFSGYDKGYGQKVIISHGYGYKTIYAHLSKSLVRQGQKINRGEIIALSGNSGVSTGPHMHYEVHKNNSIVNPTAYFFDEAHPERFITIQKPSPEELGNNS